MKLEGEKNHWTGKEYWKWRTTNSLN